MGPTLSEAMVITEDENTLERNRQLNAMLQPLTALREGVQTTLIVVFMILIGANPTPGGQVRSGPVDRYKNAAMSR